MEILLIRYKINTTRGSGGNTILADHLIEVLWDDVALAFIVNEYDSESDPTPTVRTFGPDLGSVSLRGRTSPPTDTEVKFPIGGIITYAYCDGTTLNGFRWKSTFPYAEKVLTPNSFQCVSLVCDLIFTNNTSQPASDIAVADGIINVEATSSNGVVKYSLDPGFDYATEGQVLGTFPGLLSGDYTVTAKDEIGCIDQIVVNVGLPTFYNIKYRLEFDDLKDGKTRTDILERGYEGELSEVTGTGVPVNVVWPDTGTNKFNPIIPSKLILELLSETNFQFRELFTQDDRKFLINHYRYSRETRPAFIPAEMDDLADWLQTAFSGLGTYYSWSGLSITMVGISNSQYKYTLYAFEPGQNYSFDYQFSATSSSYGSKQARRITIRATNSSWADLGANKSIGFSSNGSISGNFSFTAPVGADRIIIFVTHYAPSTTYTIDSFTNETLPAGEEEIGFELFWTGYIISQNYREDYIAPPYGISITATDGLEDLKTFDFVDVSGNLYKNDIITLKAICEILKKTDLQINVQAGINKYEADMNETTEDDPLNQCMFDPAIFYDGEPSDCYEVLSEILKSFGAKIRQRMGKWFMYCTEECVHEIAYREFNLDTEFVESGEVDDGVNIEFPIINTGVVFRDKSQSLEVIPAYGKFYLTHELKKNPSLVKSYSFEADDIYISPDGVVLIRNWNVNIANDPGVTYGIKETKAFEGLYNFFTKVGSYITDPNDTNEVILTAKTGVIEYESVDAFEFSFSYASILTSNSDATTAPLFVRLKWMLKIGDMYYSEILGNWTDDVTYKYNSLYVSVFNQTQTFKIVAQLPDVDELTLDDFNIEFIFERESRVDFFNADVSSNLEAIPTVKKQIGYRVKGAGWGTPGSRYAYYTLVEDFEVTGGIEPDDHDPDDNAKVWVRDRTIPVRLEQRVDYWYLDNVVLKHFPKGVEPPNTITLESINNALFKINLEETFLLNDIDIDNINNSERTYKNYFKKLDGSPTQVWHRTYRAGEGKLLDLLIDEYKSQYKRGSNKITGTFDIDVKILPTSFMREVNDGGRKYMFMGYSIHPKESKIDFDVVELVDVVTDDESPDIDAGFTTGFSLGYRA